MPLILGTNSIKDTGFDVANSCRFDDGSSDHMHKTPGSAGSRIKWTFSVWLKRGVLGQMPIFAVPGGDTSNYDEFYFNDSNKIQYSAMVSGTQYALRTKRQFRDPTAWMHLALIYDSNNGTAGDRMQLWVNGVRTAEADMEDTTFKNAQNYSSSINNDKIHYLGKVTTNTAGIFDGYMAEVVFQNNSANSPVDKFGSFDEDSGIFKPIDVSSLTLGTNGFYLDFEASGNLGNDVGGGTDLTEVNMDAQNQSTDTCTNNFAVLNPLNPIVHTFEDGNLRIDGGGDNWDSAFSTIGASSGKFYFELKFLALSGGLRRAAMGVVDARGQTQFATNEVGYNVTNATGDSVGYNGNGTSNTIKKNDSAQYNGTQWSVDDIICMAVDLDNGAVYFRVNGGSFLNSGDPTSGSDRTGAVTLTTGESYVFGGTAYGATTEWEFNFGSPCYSESGGNSDANGHGNFNQAVPSGYFALCTKNLAENS